ncbi:MAG: SLBB domain-containing protein [bacterium]
MESFKILRFSFLFLYIGILAIPGVGRAQEKESESFLNRASQYYLGSKDEILIKVNVWGFVQKPGQYLVPRHTDLISLISFAGGPRDGANLKHVHIIRDVEVRNGKAGKNRRRRKPPIYTVNVKRYIKTGRPGIIPTLEGGDTVLISQTFGHKFRTFLGVTSVVGLMAASATLVIALRQL